MRNWIFALTVITLLAPTGSWAFDSVMNHLAHQEPSLTLSLLCSDEPTGSVPPCNKQFTFNGQNGTVRLGPPGGGFGLDVIQPPDTLGALDSVGNMYVVDDMRSPDRVGVFSVSRNGDVAPLVLFDVSSWVGTNVELPRLTGLHVDSVNGILLISVVHEYQREGPWCNCDLFWRRSAYVELIQVSGLPTLLDIILSYQPPSTLSFNVPVRPEGLPGADSFSVYTGNVRTASDLSQASALQCTVPSGRPPVPGEQLSVADSLPDPSEGDARYYLAAVNYQGQRRAGRSAINGVLQGRNAAALPVCQ